MDFAPTLQMAAAIAEMKSMILAHHPDATFVVGDCDGPVGTYLTVAVDVEDTDEVFDVVVERLLEMQVEEALPLYVLTVRPIERVIAELHNRPPAWARPTPFLD
jgi:hypothetical protein